MTGAIAIGVPGWPELAFWTASIDRVRMVLMHNQSSDSCFVPSSGNAAGGGAASMPVRERFLWLIAHLRLCEGGCGFGRCDARGPSPDHHPQMNKPRSRLFQADRLLQSLPRRCSKLRCAPVLARIAARLSELGTEQQDLSRVVDPDEDDHEGTCSTVSGSNLAAAD